MLFLVFVKTYPLLATYYACYPGSAIVRDKHEQLMTERVAVILLVQRCASRK